MGRLKEVKNYFSKVFVYRILCQLLVLSDNDVNFLLVQGGHLSHGSFYLLFS